MTAARLDAFLAVSESIAAALVARDGTVLETNAALERIVGPTPDIRGAIVPGQSPLVAQLVAAAGPDWKCVQAGLVRQGRDPLDCRFWAAAHGDHVLLLAEQLTGPIEKLHTLLLDLNDDLLRARRELAARNRELRELDELKDMFLASATHDLQQPLTSLLAYAELLGEEELRPEAGRMALIIEKNARRMTVMINDLLGAATIMTGDLQLVRRRTDLVAVVRAALDGIQPAAAAGGVTVSISPGGPDTVEALVDERRVLQVLDNLLSNAVKYSPDGGHVRVGCDVVDGVVRITVSDTGIGIPLEEQDRLFDRYFRASTALDHGVDGTGLGLANARAFAEAHGGTLTCTSEPGSGSTFTLVLPAGSEDT